jgi:hypothetical protein
LDPNFCDEILFMSWENWILILMCSTHNLISCLDSQSENQFNFNRRFKFNYLLQIISMILENHLNFNMGFKVQLPCSHNWWLIWSFIWFCAPIYVSKPRVKLWTPRNGFFTYVMIILLCIRFMLVNPCWKGHLSSHGNFTFVGTTHSSANFTPSNIWTFITKFNVILLVSWRYFFG